MIIGEVILSSIIDAIIGSLLEKGSDTMAERLRRNPTKKAFQEALKQTFERLNEQHPQWIANDFDASFFEKEGAPVLAQLLLMDGQLDATELAKRWADSLNVQNPERRAFYISELEPVAVDFLEDLAHELKGKEALRDLNISRALEQSTEALQSIRRQLNAEKATFGTQQDYLQWLIGRNLYLDPRGTFQTERQIQVGLDQVYISLQAEASNTLKSTDQHTFEKYLAEIEIGENSEKFSAEERENQNDFIRQRLENRLNLNKPSEVLELAEVVTRYDRVVILGDPGSGKTTLLRYLALEHAQALYKGLAETSSNLGQALFPILLRIAEYAQDGNWKRESLSDFLTHCYAIHDCPKRGLADLLQSHLEKGGCLVLLDGLDEIVSAEERLGVVRQIEDFVRRYGVNNLNRFVITSRIAGYYSAPLEVSFIHYKVREMNEEQIQQFLERWCHAVEYAQTPKASPQERANIAQREINGITLAIKNPGVRRLAVNPLLLRILALIHRSGARLPQKRIELYKLASDTLARTWRPAQGVSEEAIVKESALLKEDYLTPLLSTLAYWLHVNKPTGIATEYEIYDVLGDAWSKMNEIHWDPDNQNPKTVEEIRKFLSAVHKHTGLFVERAPKRYGFMHLTFEEYYVARYLITNSRKRAKLIRKHLHQPRWEEPILLALGFVGLDYPKEAGELVETAILAQGEEAEELEITPDKYEDLLGRDHLFALRCLSDNIPIRPKLLQKLITEFTNELLGNTTRSHFRRYQQALTNIVLHLEGSKGAPVFLTQLLSHLQDRSMEAEVRINAAQALGRLGARTPEIQQALVTIVQDRSIEAEVRSNAAQALGRLGARTPEIQQALVTIVQDRSIEAEVRRNAAQALGQLGARTPETQQALVTIVQDRSMEAEVRRNAALALGQLGARTPEIQQALVTIVQDRSMEAEVRSNAAQALGQLGANTPEIQQAIVTFLQDRSIEAEVRRNAAQALGRLGARTPETQQAIVTFLRDRSIEAEIRRNAAYTLGLLGARTPETQQVVVTIVQDRSIEAEVRINAAQALGLLGARTPEIQQALVTIVQDRSIEAEIRSNAAYILGQLGARAPEIQQALVTIVQDRSIEAEVRRNAAQALGQLGARTPETQQALVTFLQDRSIEAEVRSNAALALGQVSQITSEIVEGLCQMLRGTDDWTIRQDAAKLLGQVTEEHNLVISTLREGLLDEDNDVRDACTQALVRLGKQSAALTHDVERIFIQAIHDPKFTNQDKVAKRPAFDYAYTGLWSLVTNDEREEN